MRKKGMLLHPEDNVVVVLEPVLVGDTILVTPCGEELVARDTVEFGHKLARGDMEQGQMVLKYGSPMGKTLAPIARGDHVHVHNIAGLMGGASGESGPSESDLRQSGSRETTQ